MSKDLEQSILLDFYGPMLTDKQRNLMELYYNEDLSLGEIAELAGITRQGVQDSIRRSSQFLTELEQKLGIAARYHKNLEAFQEVRSVAEELSALARTFGAPRLTELTERLHQVAATGLEE